MAQRLQLFSGQIERETLQLANMRRTAPAETARRFEERFASETQSYDTRLQKHAQSTLESAKATTIDLGAIERIDETRDSWQQGTETLANLKTSLGGTVARMEKALKAVDAVEGR